MSRRSPRERDLSPGALVGAGPTLRDWRQAARRSRRLAAVVALAHLAVFIVFVAWMLPRPEQDLQVAYGVPELVRSSTPRTVEQAIRVGPRRFGCLARAVGPASSCPPSFEPGVTAKVTYFEMPTLDARLGLTDKPLVLVAIEQDGAVVYSNSAEAIRKHFLLSGLLIPACVFGVSLLLWVRFILRRGKGLPSADPGEAGPGGGRSKHPGLKAALAVTASPPRQERRVLGLAVAFLALVLADCAAAGSKLATPADERYDAAGVVLPEDYPARSDDSQTLIARLVRWGSVPVPRKAAVEEEFGLRFVDGFARGRRPLGDWLSSASGPDELSALLLSFQNRPTQTGAARLAPLGRNVCLDANALARAFAADGWTLQVRQGGPHGGEVPLFLKRVGAATRQVSFAPMDRGFASGEAGRCVDVIQFIFAPLPPGAGARPGTPEGATPPSPSSSKDRIDTAVLRLESASSD